MNEQTTAALRTLRSDDPPLPSTVDITRAIVAGRRATGVRRGLTATAAAVVVAAIALIVPVLWRSGSHEPAGAPAQFSVFRPVLRVGSADGYVPTVYLTGTTFQRAYLQSATPRESATVTVYPAGSPLSSPGPGPDVDLGPPPTIGGHEARWQVPVSNDMKLGLTWQWQPGSWALAQISGSSAAARQRLIQVAASVRPASVPVRFPFTLPAPGQLKIARVLRRADGTGVVLQLTGQHGGIPILVGVTQHPKENLYTGGNREYNDDQLQAIPLARGWIAVASAEVRLSDVPGLQASSMRELVRSVTLLATVDRVETWVRSPLR